MKKLHMTLLVCLGLASVASAQTANVRVGYGITPYSVTVNGGTTNSYALIAAKHSLSASLFDGNSRTETNLQRGRTFTADFNSVNNSYQQLRSLRGLNGSQLFAKARRIREEDRMDLIQVWVAFQSNNEFGRALNPGAYSVCNRNFLRPNSGPVNLSPGHEIGHNFTAEHRDGFCMNNGERTVMRVNVDGGCDSATRINWFSSGVVRKNNVRLGTSSQQNRGPVRNRRFTTANFR